MAGGLVVLVTAAVILTTLFIVLRSAGGLNMIRELAAEQPESVQAAQILGGTAVLIVALSLPLIVSASSFSGATLAADVALEILQCAAAHAHFALRTRVFTYPDGVSSVWAMLAVRYRPGS